jgi:hypothetical protein
MHGMQLAEVLLGYPVPPVGLGDGAVTLEQGERRGGSVPKKEPYFLPPVQGFGHGEINVRINAMLGLDVDVHATQHCCIHIRAPWEPDMKEAVSQVKVGVNPHEGLAPSHKGRVM